MSEKEKRVYEAAAHANDGYVPKDSALIVFRVDEDGLYNGFKELGLI